MKEKDDKDFDLQSNLSLDTQRGPPGFAYHLNIIAHDHLNFNYFYGTVLWLSFFLPLTERRYIENAFNQGQPGINIICLYAALSMFFLLSWPTYYFIWRWNNPNDPAQLFNNYKLGINISLVFAFIGAAIKPFSFLNY